MSQCHNVHGHVDEGSVCACVTNNIGLLAEPCRLCVEIPIMVGLRLHSIGSRLMRRPPGKCRPPIHGRAPGAAQGQLLAQTPLENSW